MEFKQCNRCAMDTTAKEIVFDKNGNCNFCNDFIKKLNNPKFRLNLSFEDLVLKIKEDGKGKKYDCIIGISGGVDSSYVLHKAIENGLRPLAIHMDSGWNTKLADDNMKNLISSLNVDLYTYNVDKYEYGNTIQAFFESDVLDIELFYDNIMLAINYEQAKKHNIKYILSGSNISTEGMKIPSSWNWIKHDKKNINKIASLRNIKIKETPLLGTFDFINYEFIKKIKWIPFLDYLPKYNKFEALDILIKKYHYQPYPYKHYESIFTRFYQGYLLPKKFGVDKRKLHLSTLIITGQITKEDALIQLKNEPYPTKEDLHNDINFFLKNMSWSQSKLDEYLKRPEKSHLNYGSEKWLWDFLLRIYKVLKK